jgi:membrane protein YqaA with SNARE-associated domain
VKIHPMNWLHNASAWTMALLKPLGFWGLGALSFVDAGLFPIPPTMDLVVIGYVMQQPSRLLLYCFVAALGSALGSLIPYYIGRAGGELFLLKRINRQRYEQMRDKFEKQEFMVIAIPAVIPPPFPLKLFEFAAGVFEMKPLWFVLAIFSGKFVRFLAWSIISVLYGPTLMHSIMEALHKHLGYVMGGVGILIVIVGVYTLRKLFDRRRGTQFPAEDDV